MVNGPIRSGVRVVGMEKVLNTINKKLPAKQTKNLKQGMIALGFKVQRDSQKMTPIDLGNLKASAFTMWTRGRAPSPKEFKGKDASQVAADTMSAIAKVGADVNNTLPIKPEVAVAYGAAYAIFVHENETSTHLTKKKKQKAGGKKRGKALLKAVVQGEVKPSAVRQNGEAKFLEKAFRMNVPVAASIIRKGGWRR